MKIQNPFFFHFCEFFGKGAPFHIQIISYLLAVKGDRKIFALVYYIRAHVAGSDPNQTVCEPYLNRT